VSKTLHPVQVVVAYDLSPSGEEALTRALDIVARAPHHVLHVVTVLDDYRGGHKVGYRSADDMHGALREYIHAAFLDRERSDIEFFVYCRIGKPAVEILSVAEEVGADLVFVGSHDRHGIDRVLSGSTAERVVRDAKCPVMVVKPKSYAEVTRQHVVQYDHPRSEYHPPHRYSYVETRMLTRPADWPLV
jgi:nucleotide-binding universal stress UspA family protein